MHCQCIIQPHDPALLVRESWILICDGKVLEEQKCLAQDVREAGQSRQLQADSDQGSGAVRQQPLLELQAPFPGGGTLLFRFIGIPFVTSVYPDIPELTTAQHSDSFVACTYRTVLFVSTYCPAKANGG